MKRHLLTLTIMLVAIGVMPAAAQQVTVTNASITGDTFWTADTEYIMDGNVYVEDGETLTIEAGTVIKGLATPTTGDQETALIVARGGKIFAEGTRERPIIFTSEDDDVNDPFDLTEDDKGLWGGVIILGRATINAGGGENSIEGLPPTDPRNLYGGTDDDDDSGVFRYVSIRHGGAIFGTDNEINGLSMGAVGRGTTIEYVEVFANQDDAFEWFGGTVDTKYLVASHVGDDAFDYDEGFRGRGQFWFMIHGADDGGSGGEHDGGTDPETGEPFAIPVIHNATYIGSGATGTNLSNDRALKLRDNAGGKYFNSIFTDFAGTGINIEDLASGEDSRSRLENGDLVIENNIWWAFGNLSGNAIDANNLFEQDFVQSALLAANNVHVDPQLRGVSRTDDGGLDPRPAEGSPALTRDVTAQPRDGFYTWTTFQGAFKDVNWLEKWTFTSQGGFTSTATEDLGGELPTTLVLDQNFPNPFSGHTAIEFRLAETQQVRLAVYDVLGREVTVLIDGVQAAGNYRTEFDASNLAPGMYLYRITTERGTQSKSMMLLK